MNLRFISLIGSISMLTAGGALMTPARTQAQDQDTEELTRGPVHEAFASSVGYDPQPGILVSKAPPAMIEEAPPDQRPEGDNVTWIPGYWGWDSDQNDFIWISGVWRNLPPGRQWVPGYWAAAGDKWQWTSGYWANQETKEISYLPQPPKSIEAGPNVAAPSVDDIWIPGTWTPRDDRYVWRPGYWEPGRPGWVWIPAHFQWTRRGFIFIGGYWDYAVDCRGVLFAPVCFHHGFHHRPGFFFTPAVVISLDVFMNHLFVRPGYGHYYFGDYYAPGYRSQGFFASFSFESGRHGYDPIFSYCRWEHRHESGWESRRRDDFAFYRDHKEARPPATWAALMALPEGKRGGGRDHYAFARSLKDYAMARDGGRHFQTLDKEGRDKIVAQGHEIRQFGQERLRLENRAADKPGFATREALARSPVLGKRADQFTGNDAPPKPHTPHGAIIPETKSSGHATEMDKHTVIPERTDLSRGNGHAELIQPGKTDHRAETGSHAIIPDKTSRTEHHPVEPVPHVERPTVEPTNRFEHKGGEPSPRVERQPIQPTTPRIERPAVEPPNRFEHKAAEPTPRTEHKAVEPSPHVEHQPIQPTPRTDRHTVQPTPHEITPSSGSHQAGPGNQKRRENERGSDDKQKNNQ